MGEFERLFSRFFSLKYGRRPAGYIAATENLKAFDDPGKFIEMPLVNKIHQRVKAWIAEYSGINLYTNPAK